MSFYKVDATLAMINWSGQDDLLKAVLKSAIEGPQKYACNFFNDYFAAGNNPDGKASHPLLGNLLVLADVIDERYDSKRYGTNLVTGLIRCRLNATANPQLEAETDEYSPMCQGM